MNPALPVLLMAISGLSADQRLVEGNPSAKVRMIVYEDLQCSDCADFRKMFDDKLLPKYGDAMAVEHRDFPLPKHAWAMKAAIAARYFQTLDPKLSVDFRRMAMANQSSITAENFEEKLAAFCRAKGIDPAKARAALANGKLARLVDADFQEGVARGVAHTPTIFIDGEPYIETFTVEEISKGIEAAVARSKQ